MRNKNVILGYAKNEVTLSIPENRLKHVLTVNSVDITYRGEQAVVNALENPIGTPRLCDMVKSGQKVVIITSDISRPMPSMIALPPLVAELNKAGVADKDITVVFALGSHRKHTQAEQRYLVGDEMFERINCIDSDVNDCTRLGTTSHGTVVDIFTPVVKADFLICMGNIEYHYFAGYSGGAKAVMPGVSTMEAIRQNHSMMVDERACAGNLLSPVRQDIEEVVSRLLPVHFILNVVLDEHKKIIKAVAGDVTEAHRAGCAFLDSIYKVELDKRADIVVCSAGGFPKDANMYQAQKALDNAKHAVNDGGIIIWLADCTEGLGSATFEKWMCEKTPDQRISEIRTNFVLGGHKAAAVALVQKRARIFLVSSLDPDFVRGMYLEPYSDVATAFDEATAIMGENSSVIVMPFAGSTLPTVK